MANPVCTQASLIEGGKCFKNFDSHSRKALKVYFMAKQLAAIGGTDYTLGHDGTLNTTAQGYCGLLPDRDLMAVAWIVIEYNNAVEAGASVSADPQTLADEIKCLEDFPDWKLTLMELLLRCELGRSSPYPQP